MPNTSPWGKKAITIMSESIEWLCMSWIILCLSLNECFDWSISRSSFASIIPLECPIERSYWPIEIVNAIPENCDIVGCISYMECWIMLGLWMNIKLHLKYCIVILQAGFDLVCVIIKMILLIADNRLKQKKSTTILKFT